MRAMRALRAISLGVRFVMGATLGTALGVVFFFVALARAARPIHAEGVLCTGELLPRDPELGARLAGPVLVRFSGAFADQRGQKADVLGLLLRLRQREYADSVDPRQGDQDLLLGSFESFLTAARDRAATDVADYLANHYSTVAPWWLPGRGAATLRLTRLPSVTDVSSDTRPSGPGAAPSVAAAEPAAAEPPPRSTLGSRIDRLDAALASDRARLLLVADLDGTARVELAELRLLARVELQDHTMQASMFNCGRGVRPVGFRNGLRATLYPMSQFGRLLRGR